MNMLFEWLVSNAITASLLALVALAVAKAWPKRPAIAHACWVLVLVKLLTPPVYQFSFNLPAQHASLPSPVITTPPATTTLLPVTESTNEVPTVDLIDPLTMTQEATGYDTEFFLALPPFEKNDAMEPLSSTTVSSPAPVTPSPWAASINQVWVFCEMYGILCLQLLALAGSGLLLIVTILRIVRFERLLRLSRPAEPEFASMMIDIGLRLKIERLPELLIVPGKVGPLLWPRWNRPAIVIPEGLLETIDHHELKTVLAHELTHYRRGDHLWRYLELAAVTFYWWLPTAWWASRRLRQAEEECCDAGVVATLPDGVASYATALVRSLTFVAEPSSPCPALSSGLGPVTLLKRRLNMLHAKIERKLGVRGWLLLAAVAAVALPVGISWADDDTPPPPRREAGRRVDETRADPVRALPPRDDVATPRAASAPRAPQGVAGTLPPGRPAQPAFPTTPAPLYDAYLGYAATVSAPYPQGSGSEEMRSAMEMNVRQAELDLKTRRIKVRQAENAIKLAESELRRAKDASRSGSVSQTELNIAEARLDQARSDFELAQVDVERGELAVEQAKRRMSSAARTAQPPPMSPVPSNPFSGPMNAAPGGPGAPSTPAMPPLGGRPGGMSGSTGGGLGGAMGGESGGRGGSLGGGMPPGGLGGGFGRGLGSGGPPQADAFFRNFDRQNNGKIRREDVPEWMRDRFFEILDTNKDGVVDQSEFNANYNKLWETASARRMSPAGGRGGPGGPGAGGRGEGVARAEGGSRSEGGRGGDASPPGGVAERRAAPGIGVGRDQRDERIEQLEQELKEMRKALESMRTKDRPPSK